MPHAPHRPHSPLALLAAALAAAPAAADAPPDKSAYSLSNPTPRSLLRDMSTDRPDTTESPYTVDAGRVQLELSFLDFTRDREDGRTTRTWQAAPFLLKLGLLNQVDLQLGLDPSTRVDGDPAETRDGLGDAVIRLKANLFGNDEPGPALALMPFVKLPTADEGLGNGNVEGGLIVPLAIPLAPGWNLGTMAELDFNRADGRTAVDLVHTATLAHELTDDVGLYVEYAGFAALSGGDRYRGYFDAGLTLALSRDLQLDAGVRVGLTAAADDLGLFTGISVRF